jgi:hypothetical protein
VYSFVLLKFFKKNPNLEYTADGFFLIDMTLAEFATPLGRFFAREHVINYLFQVDGVFLIMVICK